MIERQTDVRQRVVIGRERRREICLSPAATGITTSGFATHSRHHPKSICGSKSAQRRHRKQPKYERRRQE